MPKHHIIGNIMNMQNKFTKYLLTSFFIVLFGTQLQTVQAQSVDFGADFVNRYVWRGIDFGNSASVQPYIEYSSGGFSLGSWASYAVSPVDNNVTSSFGASEHDLYIGYSFGAVSVAVTDYYFPAGSQIFDFEAAHVIEPSIGFTGGEAFPITLYAAMNVHNDPDDSIYLEASIPLTIGETDLAFAVGGVPAETGYYGTADAAIINMNLSVARDVVISESFSLPLFASYVLNPYAEQSYLVFGFSL